MGLFDLCHLQRLEGFCEILRLVFLMMGSREKMLVSNIKTRFDGQILLSLKIFSLAFIYMYKLPYNHQVSLTVSVLFIYISCAQALAIKHNIITSRSSSDNNTEAVQCGFSGDSDILGIGIRIGYYTQSLSVWFANYFVSSEAKVLRSVNLLFLVALFIALVWLVHSPQQTYAIEVYLLLRLLFATWYVGVLDRSKFNKTKWRKSHIRVVVRESSLLGLLAYTVWFAWIGLDRVKGTPCGTFVFFATKINLYGTYRSVFKAFSVSALVFGTIKQSDTAVQLSQRWRGTYSQDPNYFSQLQQNLIEEASQSVTTAPTSSEAEILEAAVEMPLPLSPYLTESSTGSTNSAVSGAKDFPSLEELMTAERYFQSIINIDVRDHSRWCYEIKWIPLKIFLPSIHSPATLSRRANVLYRLRPFRWSIILPLFRHIKSLSRFPLYSYAFMIEAALRSPYHKDGSPRTLITALTLHKAQLPPSRPAPNIAYHAITSLSLCIVLILSIELSIHWNSITGLSNLGAVGQLIPAIIGLGGLLKVLWIWWTKGEINEREKDGPAKEVRDCAELYEKLKKEKETATQ